WPSHLKSLRKRLALRNGSKSAALLVDLVVGPARVELAIGAAFEAMLAAEVEVLAERIANRPLAGGFGELQQVEALVLRDEQLGHGRSHVELLFHFRIMRPRRGADRLRARSLHARARLAGAATHARHA